MSRQLFPVILFGMTDQETTGSTMPEVVEGLKEVPTRGQVVARDFRPTSANNRLDGPADKAVPAEAPKASSVTGDAESSPNESPTSLPVIEDPSADVVKESKEPDNSEPDDETKMTGNDEPPVLVSIPAPALLPTSSSQ